jgi:hypothetical protein
VLVVTLKSRDLAALAPHRHRDGWEIAMSENDTCFLKIPPTTQNENSLTLLPCLTRWTLDQKGQKNHLIPLGKQLPTAILPPLPWLPLASFLPLTTTKIQENETFFGHLGFALIPSHQNQPATALRLPFQTFSTWAETAPAPRLAQLTFALSDTQETLVIGSPLPPLPGQTYYQIHQLLIPCGLALPDFILAQDLATSPEQLHLIDRDSTVHSIPRELCLPATRSTIRTTAHAL